MAKKTMGPGPKKTGGASKQEYRVDKATGKKQQVMPTSVQKAKAPATGSGNPFTGASKPRGSAYSTAAQKRMKAEAAANSESDKLAREKVEKLNEADNLIFQTEKQIKEFGDKLPADKKPELESALSTLKDAHKSQDIPSIDAAITSLNAIWQAATQEMYQSGQAGDPNVGQDPNAGGHSGNTSNNNGDVTDVEYEEVNDKK